MSNYTPTDDEVREALEEWAWSRRMFRPEVGASDPGFFDRWMETHGNRGVAQVVAAATPLGYASALSVIEALANMEIDTEATE